MPRVNDEEVNKALFDICDNMDPRPDGFTSKFYEKAWYIVRKDMCEAVKEFFYIGKLLGEVNATLITLVLKRSTAIKPLPSMLVAKGMNISKEGEDLGNEILCHPTFLLVL
ncbi:hypothetical protein Tco_1566031 [Tanacetum coccineum]